MRHTKSRSDADKDEPRDDSANKIKLPYLSSRWTPTAGTAKGTGLPMYEQSSARQDRIRREGNSRKRN